MLAPDIIHSEEDSPGSTGLGHANGGRGPGSSLTTPSRPEPTSPTTSTTTTATHTQHPRHHSTSTTTTTTTTPLPPYPQPPVDYDYPFYPEVPFQKETNKVQKEGGPHEAIHSDGSGSVALIISIVAGTLIVVILIVLLVLKFKGRQDGAYKVDESKNYEGIPTVPTPMINGQGNGAIKPGDRRPVKKQSKDVKEWYV